MGSLGSSNAPQDFASQILLDVPTRPAGATVMVATYCTALIATTGAHLVTTRRGWCPAALQPAWFRM